MKLGYRLQALVSALDEVHAHEAYKGVWAVAQLHLGPYRGPTYTKELERARRDLTAHLALASPPPRTEEEQPQARGACKVCGSTKDTRNEGWLWCKLCRPFPFHEPPPGSTGGSR